MKSVIILLIGLTLATPSVRGFPAQFDDAEEVDVVPLEKQRPTLNFPNIHFDDFDGVIDTGSFEPESGLFGVSSYNPFQMDFSGLLHSLDAYMRRLRDRFSNVWTRLPYPDTDTDVGLGIVGKEDKGNTTSKVEIIDGQKVVVNETVYTKNTDFGTSIVKVRTVEVMPNGDDEHVTSAPSVTKKPVDVKPTRPSTTTPRDTENDSDEISNLNGSKVDETYNEIETIEHNHLALVNEAQKKIQDAIVRVNENDSSEESTTATEFSEFGLNRYQDEIDDVIKSKSSPSSLPLYQQFKTHQFAPQFLSPQKYFAQHQPYYYQHQKQQPQQNHQIKPPTWESFEDSLENTHRQHQQYINSHNFDFENSNHNKNDNNNEHYNTEPIDLSNDIAINQMLADQGAPHNPDAEFISQLPPQQYQRFEAMPVWQRPTKSDFYSKYETIKK